MKTLIEVVLDLDVEELLSAIWYTDGSGANTGAGVEGVPSDWIVVNTRLDVSQQRVRLWLERKPT